ncbi:metallothiol transferase FosB [Sporosalibacterium faouarense]|uniref:metallothiol transferase FosB n=1 Tax=Sporosalibacterium faouarense TaxID=516123 RepID=UPI00141C84A2|nr:metallothiol transferase FosB [Bacillota bacterium]
MKLNGINHITFSVSNLEKSIKFYQDVFEAKILVKGNKLAYFDINGLWIALNVEKNVSRNEIYDSYTHISFSIDNKEYDHILTKLKSFNVDIVEGRQRHIEEGKSIYFRDLDGHLFELHTKSRKDRIEFYKKYRKDLKFYST